MNTVPTPIPTRLLHGDFRTGNTLAVEDHLTAIIDWEIWSRSDPRIDLAWFLIFVEADRRPPPSGMPCVEELIGTYDAVSGVEITDLDWFRALVRYKQTAAWAFITRNARRRGAAVSQSTTPRRPFWSPPGACSASDARRDRQNVGGPESVAVEDWPDPEPGPGQVVVAVESAAVNYPDVLIVANKYQVSIPPPFIPGSEWAGVVEATGDSVTALAVGDRVAGGGSWAHLQRSWSHPKRSAGSPTRFHLTMPPPSPSSTARPIRSYGPWPTYGRVSGSSYSAPPAGLVWPPSIWPCCLAPGSSRRHRRLTSWRCDANGARRPSSITTVSRSRTGSKRSPVAVPMSSSIPSAARTPNRPYGRRATVRGSSPLDMPRGKFPGSRST